jgi:phosphoribosyl-ATP pyrophosphohydrolase/phosphoribosyl-AMP cyclohydrolase
VKDIVNEIKFDPSGLIPAIAQEVRSDEVLMLAYMNRTALTLTLSTGWAHYYSRTRGKLWKKGETSGNFQRVRAVYYDCDADAILLKVEQTGVACHTGAATCFSRRLDSPETLSAQGPAIIKELSRVIAERKKADPGKSYVASLFAGGAAKISQKIFEESAELASAARREDKKKIVAEFSDLLFHALVLLGYKDIAVEEVFDELRRRFGVSGIEEKKSRKSE